MILKGILYTESPIYRGNARKTLFTRDGDGTHKMISLAGDISGTAQSLMDAFVGESKNRKNIGLLNQLWYRLYSADLPKNLIKEVKCSLQQESYPANNFFDLRMGIKLDEDRWAAEANANYKMETVLKNSKFDFIMNVDDKILSNSNNQDMLYHLIQELKEGRFWFGAGKSKGLGRVRLDINLPFGQNDSSPQKLNPNTNHLRININFDAMNPILVGWNWGKVDTQQPSSSFPAIEAQMLIESLKDIPDEICKRLLMVIGGPILNAEDWKRKFAETLPRIIAIWLKEKSSANVKVSILPLASLTKLGKGKYGLNKKIIEKLKLIADNPFEDVNDIESKVIDILAKKANMLKRVMGAVEQQTQQQQNLDQKIWESIAIKLGFNKDIYKEIEGLIDNEPEVVKILSLECQRIFPRFFEQIDQQIKLLHSDIWVDSEIKEREEHLKIKNMLMDSKISEYQWNDPGMVPDGVKASSWREFLESHARVRYAHMLNRNNLKKSIVNDQNQIAFLKTYRKRTRQELSQLSLIDFRAGGPSNREISKKYGKPYDTVFMRMLSWKPSEAKKDFWEIYIPGSTIKGAFKKRASQILKTIWGESKKTTFVLNRLFGTQGQRGMIFFSDAYLSDPNVPDQAWCSMDGIKMDPKNGQPIETSKRDFLFAYGDKLVFNFLIDIQDISRTDLDAFALFNTLIKDFKQGEIPLGGQKTSGLGWVNGKISKITLLTTDPDGIYKTIFGKQSYNQKGLWNAIELKESEAENVLQVVDSLVPENKHTFDNLPVSRQGFISHKAFGGYCGTLHVEANFLTPVHIQESGEPSFNFSLDGEPINGWDFFSMSSPDNNLKPSDRLYSVPSQSMKGMLKHIYSIVTNSKEEGKDISRLNPAESLFGWVGEGPNQALMGRLSFGFGTLDKPDMSWFKVPYPYGDYHYINNNWENIAKASAMKVMIGDNQWRIFQHAPIAPIVLQVDNFNPDAVQASYFKAAMPGTKARFTIKFWNLSEEEVQKLIWCIKLENGLAHKIGKNKYLGFGSLNLEILSESYFIDWEKRYSNKSSDQWKLPISIVKGIDTKNLNNYSALKEAINAQKL